MRYDFYLHDMDNGKKVRSVFVISRRFDLPTRDERISAVHEFAKNDERFKGYKGPNEELSNRIHSFWSAEGMGC
jgi:hypothetical protein